MTSKPARLHEKGLALHWAGGVLLPLGSHTTLVMLLENNARCKIWATPASAKALTEAAGEVKPESKEASQGNNSDQAAQCVTEVLWMFVSASVAT